MKYILIISATVILALCKCNNSDADEVVSVQAPKPGSIDEIIRNPADAVKEGDTNRLAKFQFDSVLIRRGKITEGTKVHQQFHFKNIGKVPLLISSARSNCGCTIPTFPKNAIPAGDTGTINVVFDTEDKPGYQKKPIRIKANTFPSQTTVFLQCEVIKNKTK